MRYSFKLLIVGPSSYGSESNRPPTRKSLTWLKHGVGSAYIQYSTRLEHRTKPGLQGKSLLHKDIPELIMIYRKIIQSALTRHDHAAAREAYYKMSESGKDEPVTRYLMYKSGLRGGDTELGMSLYSVIATCTDSNSCRMPGAHMSKLCKRCDLALCLCYGSTEHRGQETSHIRLATRPR